VGGRFLLLGRSVQEQHVPHSSKLYVKPTTIPRGRMSRLKTQGRRPSTLSIRVQQGLSAFRGVPEGGVAMTHLHIL
jgi:hypothetical protein